MEFKKKIVLVPNMRVEKEDAIAYEHKIIVNQVKGVDKSALEHKKVTLAHIANYLRNMEMLFDSNGNMTKESYKKQITNKIKQLKKEWDTIQ